ncbi:hypothetical protein DMI62_14930 [Escherichia coli]|nr:hypothetical protein [Escherichia coli]
MFVGADGIDAVNGITTFNEGYSVSGAMVTAANKVIAVLDSSKFNRRGFNQVLPIEKLTLLLPTMLCQRWINWHCRRHE